MVLCARLRLARGKGLGPISIKHWPLTILCYDTPTIFFNFIEFTLFKAKTKMITDKPSKKRETLLRPSSFKICV